MARLLHTMTSSTRSKVVSAIAIVLLICSAAGLSQALSWFEPSEDVAATVPSWDELTGDLPSNSDNAGWLYEDCFASMDLPFPGTLPVEEIIGQASPPSAEQIAELKALVDANREALEVGERASQRDKCAFSLVPREGAAADFPHLRSMHDLVLLEIAHAFVLADGGETDGAIIALARAVRHGNHGFAGLPGLKGFLHEARVVRTVAGVANTILRESPYETRSTAALRDALESVDLQADLTLAMRAEGAWGLAVLEACAGEIQGRPKAVLAAHQGAWQHLPMPATLVAMNRRVFMDEMAEIIELSARPYRAATGLLATRTVELPDWAGMASTMIPDPTVPLIRRDEAVAWKRICLIGLAIGEGDAAPEDLQAIRANLGEDTLADVFSGRPLRYVRRSDGYVLYSVGRDLKDDGGAPERHVAADWHRSGDLVWAIDA